MKHLSVLLAVLLAFLAGQWLYEQGLDARLEKAVERAGADLREIVANTAQAGEAKAYGERLFKRATSAVRWDGDLSAVLAGIASDAVQVFLFDLNGKRIHLPGGTPGLVFASEQCFAIIRAQAKSPGNRLSARELRLIDSFLGNADALDHLVNAPGRLISLISKRSERLAGIFPFRNRAGRPMFLLGTIDPARLAAGELVQEALARAARKAGPTFRFGIRDLLDSDASARFIPDSAAPVDGDGLASLPVLVTDPLSRSGAANSVFHEGRVFASAWSGRRFLVFGSSPLPSREGFEIPSLKRGMAVTAVVLLLLGWGLTTGLISLPLKLSILGIFGLTGLGGLVLVLGFFEVYAEVRQAALIRDLQFEAEDALTKVDSRFQAFRSRRSADLRRILKHVRNIESDLPLITRRLDRFKALGDTVSIHLFDERGRVLWAHRPKVWFSLNRMLGASLPRIISRMAEAAMQRHNHELGFAAKMEPKPGDLEDALYVDLGIGFFHGRGEIRPMDFAGNHVVVFADIAFDRQMRAVGFLLITFEDDCLERAFLARQRRTFQATVGESRSELLFKPVFGSGRGDRFRLDGYTRHAMREMGGLIAATSAPQWRIWDAGSHRCLLSAIPGKSLDRFTLFLRTNLHPWDSHAERFARALSIASGGFAIFIVLLGVLFSGFLLPPLGAILEAVRDLAGGRFRRPPEIRTGDLLESIGDGIAGIMEEKSEMAAARTIGEHLLPRGALETASCACRGWVRSAVELGGWIYDHRLSGDGRRCEFWIAGCEGLPIQSGLVLAMRKMSFHLLLERSWNAPEELLAEIMTVSPHGLEDEARGHLLLGTIDLSTGETRIASRGSLRWAVVGASLENGTGSPPTRFLLPRGGRLVVVGNSPASVESKDIVSLRRSSSSLDKVGSQVFADCPDARIVLALDLLPIQPSTGSGETLPEGGLA